VGFALLGGQLARRVEREPAPAVHRRSVRADGRGVAARQCAHAWGWCDGSLVRDVECRDVDQALGLVELVARCAVDYERRPRCASRRTTAVRLTFTNPAPRGHHGRPTASGREGRRLVEAVARG
jgi:hypothetical protein